MVNYINVNSININTECMTRTYDMSKRSRKAAQTTESIIEATERLLAERSLEEISLNAIAQEAEITVQTVLRHMESRDGCLNAVAERVSSRVKEQRDTADSESINEAINKLVEHYEAEGKLVLNLLAQEHSGDSFASDLTNEGRSFHRKWVKRSIAPQVKQDNSELIDALVAATDIYVWKLLRLDIGRSKNITKKVITNMVKNILEAS